MQYVAILEGFIQREASSNPPSSPPLLPRVTLHVLHQAHFFKPILVGHTCLYAMIWECILHTDQCLVTCTIQYKLNSWNLTIPNEPYQLQCGERLPAKNQVWYPERPSITATFWLTSILDLLNCPLFIPPSPHHAIQTTPDSVTPPRHHACHYQRIGSDQESHQPQHCLGSITKWADTSQNDSPTVF